MKSMGKTKGGQPAQAAAQFQPAVSARLQRNSQTQDEKHLAVKEVNQGAVLLKELARYLDHGAILEDSLAAVNEEK